MIFGRVLVTGSSRGLGLELVRQLVPVSRSIVATCRHPECATELSSIADMNKNVIVKKLDVEDFDSFPNFVQDLQNSNEQNAGLDCLINNAGYAPKSTRYNMVTIDQMIKTLTINSIAPLMLSKALIPLLKREVQPGNKSSLIVNISSILGSIHQNHPSFGSGSGGLYPYRSSKAALNMITRSLCIDLAPLGINVMSIHPGWVQTDMGGKNAPVQVEESIRGMIKLLTHFEPEKHNGNFYDYQGHPLHW